MDLVEAAKSNLTGPVLQRISALIGESPGHTQQAIDDAVPSVFEGMAEQASSTSGAARLYQMAKESGQQDGGILGKLGSGLDDNKAEALGERGQGVLRNVFGGREPAVTEQVASHAGVSRSAASKILALVSPVALAVLGKEILARGLSVSGLSSLLSSQRTQRVGEVVRPPTRQDERAEWEASRTKTHIGWLPLILLAALAGLLLAWMFGRMRQPAPFQAPIPRASDTLPRSELTRPHLPEVTIPAADKLGASAQSLTAFLDDTNAAVPKRFMVDEINFGVGDSTALSGSPASLDAIAAALKAHPTAQVRIEGFTDNVGDPEHNRNLSTARAQNVRDSLVQRGVNPTQLSVLGVGMERPIASNDSEEGQARNRRIELVVVRR